MKLFYKIIGFCLLLPTIAPNALGLSMNDFRKEVYRPDNLPGTNLGDVPTETKILHVINFGIDIILYTAGGIAVLMLIFGGITLITSLGNQERMERGKKIVKFAVLGLFAIILSYAIVTNIIGLLFRATT